MPSHLQLVDRMKEFSKKGLGTIAGLPERRERGGGDGGEGVASTIAHEPRKWIVEMLNVPVAAHNTVH